MPLQNEFNKPSHDELEQPSHDDFNPTKLTSPTPHPALARLTLERLGWSARLAKAFEPYASRGRLPGRVSAEHPGLYRVLTEDGDRLAAVAGRLHHGATQRGDLPAVGDWVVLAPGGAGDRAVIEAVLQRASKFARQAPGAGGEQIVAANVDTVLLVVALNRDFNLRRLERYVGLAWASGAQPVVVLSKADLAEEQGALAGLLARAEAAAPGVPVHALSVRAGWGLEALAAYLQPGRTVALLGSSGAGKSTLFNALTGGEGAQQATQAARGDDDRGRHTTTSRLLVPLPGGALAIDTPGMRELGMWDAEEGVGMAFPEIETLASRCGFGDCQHATEPRCAIRAALEDGTLTADRLAAYLKLQREVAHQARRDDKRLALAQKQHWKRITVAARDRDNR